MIHVELDPSQLSLDCPFNNKTITCLTHNQKTKNDQIPKNHNRTIKKNRAGIHKACSRKKTDLKVDSFQMLFTDAFLGV